ncbi:MAG: LAGLIDADG family homing endonuclease [Candidatus Woesearchaeota archaeon]
MKNIARKDLAYLAGFFDGEGSISIYRLGNNPNHIEIGIVQTIRDPLLLFAIYFKGYIQCKGRTKGGLQSFSFRTAGRENVADLLSVLYPYLIVKKAQIELLNKLHKIKLNNNGKDERIAEKWEIAKNIININSAKGKHQFSKVLQKVI